MNVYKSIQVQVLEINPDLLSLSQILCHKVTFHLGEISCFTFTETPVPGLHRNNTELKGLKQMSDHFPQ